MSGELIVIEGDDTEGGVGIIRTDGEVGKFKIKKALKKVKKAVKKGVKVAVKVDPTGQLKKAAELAGKIVNNPKFQALAIQAGLAAVGIPATPDMIKKFQAIAKNPKQAVVNEVVKQFNLNPQEAIAAQKVMEQSQKMIATGIDADQKNQKTATNAQRYNLTR